MDVHPDVRAENAKEAKRENSELGVGSQAITGNGGGVQLAEDTVIKIRKFSQQFWHELSQSDFGEEPDSVAENSKSPGAKELERTGAVKILRKTRFPKSAHRLLVEYARLLREQDKVRQVSASKGRSIKRLRDARKALKKLQDGIIELDKRLASILKPASLNRECREHFHNAMKEFEFVERTLFGIESTSTRHIHPDSRSHTHPEFRLEHTRLAGENSNYDMSGFRRLDSPYDYGLESLKKKAPLDWLIERLESKLKKRFRQSAVKVSRITRCRIISAVLESAGLPKRSPLTIKEYFVDKAKRRKKSARDLKAT